MPEQVSRFRRDDKQTCQAREYGSLDNMAAHVEYVLARCVRQAEEISKKVRAFRSLPARLRPTALRELKDNIRALETGGATNRAPPRRDGSETPLTRKYTYIFLENHGRRSC